MECRIPVQRFPLWSLYLLRKLTWQNKRHLLTNLCILIPTLWYLTLIGVASHWTQLVEPVLVAGVVWEQKFHMGQRVLQILWTSWWSRDIRKHYYLKDWRQVEAALASAFSSLCSRPGVSQSTVFLLQRPETQSCPWICPHGGVWMWQETLSFF